MSAATGLSPCCNSPKTQRISQPSRKNGPIAANSLPCLQIKPISSHDRVALLAQGPIGPDAEDIDSLAHVAAGEKAIISRLPIFTGAHSIPYDLLFLRCIALASLRFPAAPPYEPWQSYRLSLICTLAALILAVRATTIYSELLDPVYAPGSLNWVKRSRWLRQKQWRTLRRIALRSRWRKSPMTQSRQHLSVQVHLP